MQPAAPDRRFLAAQVRWAMGRGLPAQAAEDVVFDAWLKAADHFDPTRGTLQAFMQRIVRNDCAYWWRRQRRETRAHEYLRLLPDPSSTISEERASRKQDRFIHALSQRERTVFNAWALQQHLGKGIITSKEVGESLGMEPHEYDNAKRRLRTRLNTLLGQFGWTVRALIYGDDDVERTG